MVKKKILVVDDSALMRRVICDIINSDERFEVVETASNGKDALSLLIRKQYDAVVLDVNMPVMTGLQLLNELKKNRISVRVMMASTDTAEGAKTTLDALELGALDFVHKPSNALDCRKDNFKFALLRGLSVVVDSKPPTFERTFDMEKMKATRDLAKQVKKHRTSFSGKKILAIASSTGGPKALQSVIPRLPGSIDAPVVLVQHMPVGFTKSLAERLDTLSEIRVKEAEEGDVLEKGTCYLSRGGKHMNIVTQAGVSKIHYSDEPNREGVKPCANYMYESLMDSPFDEVVCVVLTGMGADGTEGISNLKSKKKTHVIAQREDTCAVYGMPKSIVKKELQDQIVPLDDVAQEIIMNVGVM